MSPEIPPHNVFPRTPNPETDTLKQPEDTQEWQQILKRIRDDRKERGATEPPTKLKLLSIIEKSFTPES